MIRRIVAAAAAVATLVPGTQALAAPAAPANLRVVGVTPTTATLAWDPVAGAVFSYEINNNGSMTRIVTGRASTFTVDNLSPNHLYHWTVVARGFDRTLSPASNQVDASTPARPVDTTPPAPPTNVHIVHSGANNVRLAWTASTDDAGVSGYEVRLADKRIAMSTDPSAVVNGLRANTDYAFTVVAKDFGGHTSTPVPVAVHTRPGADPVGEANTVAVSDDVPWGLVFLPDGSALYSERDTFRLYHLTPTGEKTLVATIPDVATTSGEGGLLGLEFRAGWLYVYHTTATDNRIVRFRYVTGTLDLTSRQVLVSGIARSKFHNGGRLRFGPDGKLYASVGDAQNSANAQDLNSLNGKVLRLNPDGTVPADNPFPGKYVYSYGHRNPQGLAFDSHGRLWEAEFGNNDKDELNLIRKGDNYGWPICEGPCGIHDRALVDPVRTWRTFEASPSGLVIVNDEIYLGAENGQRLYRMRIVGDRTTTPEQLFVGTWGRLRTVEVNRAGDLWVTSTNGDKDNIPGNDANVIERVRLCP